ncbi:hypothetical protein I302_107027 [Kwoniella bestiolae CBS 10118]|uniref:Uncharacterized protein n=1 Tax=Kwoniella bestiolae CBS 10118 TaxID=1296100 RepID=A0A1B9FZR5_9TREE|nr:hypothetical protein I302_05708 [Kwoniella bestiolae CBS 10118]OCF24249.1 hypothetical protein I302_05708 [Kwoniella bestiolae CBS 10118]
MSLGAGSDLASTHLFETEKKGAYFANFTMTPTDVGKTKDGNMNLTSQITAFCEVHSAKPLTEVSLPLMGSILRQTEEMLNRSNQQNESVQSVLSRGPDVSYYMSKDDNVTASLAEHSAKASGVVPQQDASKTTSGPRIGTLYFAYTLRSEAPGDK